ncbi:MAG: HlyC/CorC family transporter [Acidobacteria bacterium]|nr:HlyC/CorC family transporter [Acidobacteriota bacterium]
MSATIGLVAVAVLIGANALFVAIEFSLVALNPSRVAQRVEDGHRTARVVQRLLARLSYHLSGAQVGITATSLLLGFVAEPAIAGLIHGPTESVFGEGASQGVSIVLALALATMAQVVLGELVPKSIAIGRPYSVSEMFARIAQVWGVVAKPLISLLDGFANGIVRVFGVEPAAQLDHTPTREEFEGLISDAAEEGNLDPEDVDLFTRSIRFGTKRVAEVLVPRPDVISIGQDALVTELVELSRETGKSRFPVFGEDAENVVGVVYVKAIYTLPVARRLESSVSAIMSEPMAVPETRELEELFGDFRSTREHLAVVIDEHGGFAGILTIEDLLEEIVGEIDDEHDVYEPALTRVEEPGSTIMAGSLHGDEVRDACGFEMPDGDYETIAGFVVALLGHIPVPGEIVDQDGWRIEVVAMDRRRVATVRVAQPRGDRP